LIDFDTEHQQFEVLSGRSLPSVFLVHSFEEVEDRAVDFETANNSAGFPAQIGAKPVLMPQDHGLGLDHHDPIENREKNR